MIFSSLFKSKPTWQHKDSNVRIAAINNDLHVQDPTHHDILINLINEDSNELVRRAALIKLNNFDYFLQASKYNSNEKVKLFSLKQLTDMLLEQQSVQTTSEPKQQLSTEQKIAFIESDNAHSTLLEQWLNQEQRSELVIPLFEQLNSKKQSSLLLTQTFIKKQNVQVQQHLLHQIDDSKLLEKLLKKACDETIAKIITDKLQQLHEVAEKPNKLKKQLQLVLSKLLALKDNLDYGTYLTKKSALEQEWQQLSTEMSCLTADDNTELTEKYQLISAQLTTIYAAKVEAFEQQKIADKLAFDKQQAKANFSKQINNANQALTTAIFESDSFDSDSFYSDKLDETSFLATLKQLSTDIKHSVLNEQEQEVFSKQVTQLREKLGQLPDIAQSVSQATALISRISQLTLPDNLQQLNDRQETYNNWLNDWKVIESKTKGVLPQSIKDSQLQIVSLWQGGLKSLQATQKDLFFQNKKKLTDIKRLLLAGKYKVCFGLFKGLKSDFILLSAKQQQQLQRDYDNVHTQLAELSDWEHYIATPRKQELLADIQNLVTTPLDNPNEQAEKVKQFRKIWNTLGHADEAVDNELNEHFNKACEEAFAPCRLFYAEQDKLREQHLVTRHKILADAQLLAAELTATDNANHESSELSPSLDFKKLDAQLNKLQHNWQHAGEIDRNEYKKLQGQFKTIIKPIKAAISAFHQRNVNEKEALITKAEALLNSDNVFTVIEEIKQLQQNWRNVGFAGNAKESKLWQRFRTINDEVFAKRAQEKSTQQAMVSQQEQAFSEQLQQLSSALANSTEATLTALKQTQQQARDLLQQITSQRPVTKSVANSVEQFINDLKAKINTANEKEQQRQWSSVFSLLNSLCGQSMTTDELALTEHYQSLSSFWQKRLREQVTLNGVADATERFEQTLAIEILAKKPSPAEYSEQRMAVQVKLMQEQMVSGSDVNLTDCLVEWLHLGQLSEKDSALLARLKAVYCVS
ncbi:hypothetical protein GCM10009111_21590 [Colwellia asteriadis]|uniref:DUF349 domain-containing protein n=1 Tax=Colwellia asteriadis TaxID=517723 RepID=A0ABP3WKK8_9GAMM